jgi:phytoene/squalene synthetase
MIHEPEKLGYLRSGTLLKSPSQPGASTRETRAYFELPVHITKEASKQAYYTIRLLVDHERTLAAYRSYAYFRWVDDWLDRPTSERTERLDFITRQQDIIASVYCGQPRSDLTREERLALDLIRSDKQPASGLQSYISHMMAVMAFDANRRGRWVSEQELDQYTQDLSIAVTEALHYFIGHNDSPPLSESRYSAAMGAHVTHMLRDTFEDITLGYFNVPHELLEATGIDPWDVQSEPYRAWVKRRVHLARSYFRQGASYLDQVKSIRCRLAGHAYMARFVGVLDAIEHEGYRIRPAYPEFARPSYALRVGGSVARHTLLRGTR